MTARIVFPASRLEKVSGGASAGLAALVLSLQIRAIVLAGVFVLAVGCQRSDFQYVEGLVTLDSVPVEGATVTFRPTAKGGMMAAGVTDAKGLYRLNPLRGRTGAGAWVGDFDVTIIKARDPGEGGRREDLTGRVEYITPPGYADAAISGLKATIKPGRNTGESVSFDLKSGFKAK